MAYWWITGWFPSSATGDPRQEPAIFADSNDGRCFAWRQQPLAYPSHGVLPWKEAYDYSSRVPRLLVGSRLRDRPLVCGRHFHQPASAARAAQVHRSEEHTPELP